MKEIKSSFKQVVYVIVKKTDLFLLFIKIHLFSCLKKKLFFRHFVFFLKVEYGFIFRIYFRFNLFIRSFFGLHRVV